MTVGVTEAQIVAHRLEKVRRTAYRTMVDRQWLSVRDTSSVRSYGGVVNLRPMMLMKAAIFGGGRNLIDSWPVMDHELRIPWGVHAGRMALGPWTAVGSMMNSTFYSTRTGGFTDNEIALTGMGWLPAEEDGIPGFGIVSTEEALAAIGLVGGVLPDDEHPYEGFGVKVRKFTVAAGGVHEFDLQADGRAEYPVRYELAAPVLDWASISEFGTLSLAPPPALGGLFEQVINATDGLGRSVRIPVQVEVT